MESWKDTICQIFDESTDWVKKLEKLNEVPIKKSAYESLDLLQYILFTGNWSNSLRRFVYCKMFFISRILNTSIYVNKSDIQYK